VFLFVEDGLASHSHFEQHLLELCEANAITVLIFSGRLEEDGNGCLVDQ
jgi:hypothetical protein